jgi:hypothetical protein
MEQRIQAAWPPTALNSRHFWKGGFPPGLAKKNEKISIQRLEGSTLALVIFSRPD